MAGGDVGAAAVLAVVVVGACSVLEDVSGEFGAVDARFGGDGVAAGLLLLLLLPLLGVDIRHFVWHTAPGARLT